jgi:membrane-bound lytic murein transglycosylase D
VERPWEVDQISPSEPTDLRLLAKAAGVSTEELRDLNPELRRLVTPPGEDYLLNLPGGSEDAFREALAQLPRVRRVGWQRRQIRQGETLSTIAQRYGTTVPTLMEMNHLKNPHQIRAGTRITVPVPALALAEPSKTKPDANGTDASLYVVQHGDTLWDIARAHQISTGDLKRWNDLQGSVIHPGHALRISPDHPEAHRVAQAHHRIRQGETLSTIAQRYGTTVPTLMEMNQLTTPHQIRAGTHITVPISDDSRDPATP